MGVVQAVDTSQSELALLVQTLVNKQEADKDKFWMMLQQQKIDNQAMMQQQKADRQVMFEQQRAMIEQQKTESLANINVLAENIKACI